MKVGSPLGLVLALVLYLVLIGITSNTYYLLIISTVPLWASYALAWNILGGYGGLFSFGHAAFFGLGAYTVVLLQVKFGISPWIGIPIAGSLGSLAGLVVGYPTFRLRGLYFALAMMAYPLALENIFIWLGLQEVTVPYRPGSLAYMQFTSHRTLPVLSLLLLAITVAISASIEDSRFGMALKAIKLNELAAESSGIHTLKWKMLAITVSAGLTAIIGGFYSVVLLVVTAPAVFGPMASAMPIVITMFGGVGTYWGPLIGAIVLVPLGEILRATVGDILPGIQGVVYGAAIILTILLAPEGIYWRMRDFLAARVSRVAGKSGLEGAPQSSETDVKVAATPVVRKLGGGRRKILTVTGLSKSFGGLKAVQEVSFDVIDGEILGVIGPNGAGKTTLFNLLNGITAPSAGNIVLTIGNEDTDITRLPPHRVCRLGVARTFQVARPFARMTVLQNATVAAYGIAASKDEAIGIARDAIARVGLTAKLNELPSRLTAKELRLLEIARALASKPALLLLDEPFAGLGRDDVEQVLPLIRTLSAQGTTVIIIEHTMHAVVRLIDRLIVLDHGRLVAEGAPDAVLRQKNVIEAYLGKKWAANAVA